MVVAHLIVHNANTKQSLNQLYGHVFLFFSFFAQEMTCCICQWQKKKISLAVKLHTL